MKAQEIAACWQAMDLPPPWTPAEGAAPGVLAVRSPIDGEVFGQLAMCDAAQANAR
ncbi:aldehyde dehydrogenase, partial [Cupriavidus sp. HMR-1]